MAGDYSGGYFSMVGVNIAAGTYYPDPYLNAAAPIANSPWVTAVQAESPFDAGDKDAVLRGIHLRQPAVNQSWFLKIKTFGGKNLIHLRSSGGANVYGPPVDLPDWNQFALGGFRVETVGTINFTVLYDILSK